MNVSVVIPAHNESLLLGETISNLHNILVQNFEEYEIVLVENGSIDDTRHICESLARADSRVTTLFLPVGDYGLALRHGIAASAYDKVIVFDADLYSGDFVKDVLRILALEQDTAVIVASKRNKGSIDTRSGYRKLGTHTLSTILRVVFGLKVSDTHGMKFVDKSLLREELATTRETGALYDTALILRAERNGKKVKEVACTVTEMRPPRTKYAYRALQTIYHLGKLRIRLITESRQPRTTAS